MAFCETALRVEQEVVYVYHDAYNSPAMFADPDGIMPDEFCDPHFMPSSDEPMFHDPRTRGKEDNNINLLHGENNREYNKWDDLKSHIPGHGNSSDVEFLIIMRSIIILRQMEKERRKRDLQKLILQFQQVGLYLP